MPAGAGKLLLVTGNTLSVTASNVSGSDSGPIAAGTVVSSNTPNPSVQGGSGAITYAWTHVSTSSGGTPTISASGIANPSWDAVVNDGIPSSSIWKLTITRDGRTASVNITVTLTWTDTNP